MRAFCRLSVGKRIDDDLTRLRLRPTRHVE
jgi:hypothetical protein